MIIKLGSRPCLIHRMFFLHLYHHGSLRLLYLLLKVWYMLPKSYHRQNLPCCFRNSHRLCCPSLAFHLNDHLHHPSYPLRSHFKHHIHMDLQSTFFLLLSLYPIRFRHQFQHSSPNLPFLFRVKNHHPSPKLQSPSPAP